MSRPVANQAAASGFFMALFLLSLLLPIDFRLGVRMNPSRLFLLLAAIPFGLKLFSGQLGGFTWVDRCMLGFVTLMLGVLLYHHGTSQLPLALSQVVEIFGGYMAGRAMIRSVPEYARFIRYFLVALLILMPFAIDEMIHHRMLINQLFSKVFAVVEVNDQTRFGLKRVQAAFPHPILYGLFCSIALASVFYLYRKQVVRRVVYMGLVMVMTFMALSSAPMLSLFLQIGLILWNKLTHGAWWLLIGILAAIITALQLFTHHGAFIIFATRLTLDPATGWTRILIWQFGIQNVYAHPLLGIGVSDWVRPVWLPPSVDNFWLLMAMRYGVPGFFLIAGAFILHLIFLIRAKRLSEDARMLRLGYVITLFGLIFVMSTVYIWDSVQVFVFFFLGAGAFLYTTDLNDDEKPPTPNEAADTSRGLRFSRFSQTAGRRGRSFPAEIGNHGISAAAPFSRDFQE